MKRIVCALLLLAALALPAWAVYLENVPTTLRQPDGATVACLIDGDEFFHRVHDAAGYTIVKDPASGWYVYAVARDGDLAPTSLVAGQDDPARLNLEKGAMPAPSRIRALRSALPYMANDGVKTPSTGTFNNLVIFIRFKDQSEFTNTVGYFDTLFNDTTAGTNAVRNYFHEASYGQLDVNSAIIPDSGNTFVVSYQDTFNRSYYCPYDSATAPDGYTGGDNGSMRTSREHGLLQRAVAAMAAQVPPGLNIDADNDGYVDNVCFLVRGPTTAWATLLWSHRWALYTQTAYINGKRVWDYNFEMETQFGVNVLCHEMGHSVGYPDLYHYYYGTGLSPCGTWDVMCSTPNPPTSTGAYMKYEYTHWIASIPAITASGTYWLKPITSPTNNCYKIASPNSVSDYFVVEYRRKTGTFETSVPGSGLLVYRIDGDFAGQGNAGWDTTNGVYDEIYIYRPNGTPRVNGTINSAYFSSAAGRTAINDGTNPSSFLHDGAAGGLDISAVSAAGDSISFYVTLPTGVAGAPSAPAMAPALQLAAPWPNPASGRVRLAYQLDRPGRARLAVYTVTGQLVTELANAELAPGRYQAAWSGADRAGRKVASGVYFVRLEAAGKTLTRRLTVLR
ncbi:MAG TPA: M6 family metalloprotease domain-containing protein [Candidatus Edwardsbacteria bacterium]|nr:M6 family metalloprotease domain-containing protein [Candidatus Edwardsbacteria bacterium]